MFRKSVRTEVKPHSRKLMEEEGSLHRGDHPHPFGGKMGASEDPPFLCSFALYLSSSPFPLLCYQSSLIPCSHTLPWYFTLHPLLPSLFLLSFLLSMSWKPLAVKPAFLSKLRMDVISLPELPCCSFNPASIDLKGRAPSTSVLLWQKGSPRDFPTGTGSRCLACWGTMSYQGNVFTVRQHACSLTGRETSRRILSPQGTRLLRFAGVRAKH